MSVLRPRSRRSVNAQSRQIALTQLSKLTEEQLSSKKRPTDSYHPNLPSFRLGNPPKSIFFDF